MLLQRPKLHTHNVPLGILVIFNENLKSWWTKSYGELIDKVSAKPDILSTTYDMNKVGNNYYNYFIVEYKELI